MASPLSRENEVLRENYSKLCNTLIDIENLLKYFVQRNVIKPEDQEIIGIKVKTDEKVQTFLKYISGPLEGGDSTGFYFMLEVMEKHGVQATKKLADDIKLMLTKGLEECDSTPKSKSSHSFFIKPQVNQASAQFSSLVRTVETILDKSSSNLELCKRFCLDLTISDDCDTLLFNDEQLLKIEQCTTFRELFKLLRKYWSYKEYCILEHIISESESEEARDELDKYEKVMSSYAGLQLISETFSPEKLPNDYVKMIVIIDKPYKKMELGEFTKIRNFIFEHLNVKRHISLPFVKFLFSSLHLEWFVPQRAVPHMVRMAQKNVEKLIINSVIYIQIGAAVILDDQKTKTRPDNKCGYTYHFVHPVPFEIVCRICKHPCKQSQRSLCCNSNFCKDHFVSKNSDAITVLKMCPMCKSNDFHYCPDYQADETIQSRLIYCPNSDLGCKWVGPLHQSNLHCSSDTGCLFENVQCSSNCGKILQCQHLKDHLSECPHYCQHCKTIARQQDIIKYHKQKCKKYILQCPNDCGKLIVREYVSEHRKVCPFERIQCEYHDVGCRSKMLRKDKEKHNKNNMSKHLSFIKHGSSTVYSLHLFYFSCIIALASFVVYQWIYINGAYVRMDSNWKPKLPEIIYLKMHIQNLYFQQRTCKNLFRNVKAGVDRVAEIHANSSKVIEKIMNDQNSSNMQLREDINDVLNIQKENLIWINQTVNDNYFNSLISTWQLHLSVLELLSLHGDRVTPVVLAMPEYAKWTSDTKPWISELFRDIEDGNQLCLSVKANKLNVAVSLLLLTPMQNSNQQDGKFTIEVLNQMSDTNHSRKEIHYDNYRKRITSEVGMPHGINITFHARSIGKVIYQIPMQKDDTTYLKDDIMYFRVSYYDAS